MECVKETGERKWPRCKINTRYNKFSFQFSLFSSTFPHFLNIHHRISNRQRDWDCPLHMKQTVTRSISCSIFRFGDEKWSRCAASWRRLAAALHHIDTALTFNRDLLCSEMVILGFFCTFKVSFKELLVQYGKKKIEWRVLLRSSRGHG